MVQNKPEPPLNRQELDEVYALPYTKNYHPSYEAKGGIPALNEVKFSIVSSRGCFGSCSFCAITFHQGRAVQSRSHESILEETKEITQLPDFKGYIHDVGGPTANFRQEACKKQITEGKGGCKHRQCLDPSPCKNLNVDHTDFISLLRKVRQVPGVKKAFVRSGIRYDYVMADKDNTFMRELVKHHVSGQLKVAPEHIAEEVLYYMQKPAGDTYDRFRQKFFAMNEKMGPSFEEIKKDKVKFAEAFKIQDAEQDPFRGKAVVQPHGNKFMVQNKPEPPLNRQELDEVYALPYTKNYHPSYEAKGGIPALNEVKFSIVSSRGCFGSCSFCAITFHQGRAVQSRSHESILEETKEITQLPDFKGYIHDVGGPTANFRQEACKKQITEGKGGCKHRQCLDPSPCKNLNVDHTDFISLLRKVRQVPGVKKAFVRSGIRYDYVMADKDNTFMRELVKHHVSGQLKVAPEHIAEEVLYYMQKPAGDTYDRFRQKFFAMNEKMGLKQYLIPYLMSSHPGSTLNSAIELAEYLRDIKYQPEQVQDFYPTPGTLSTTMFYTGLDPLTMKPVKTIFDTILNVITSGFYIK